MKSIFNFTCLLCGLLMVSCGSDSKNSSQDGESNEDHEWVDLGLPSGTKWATMNVGASSPTDAGDYFAWGELSPKDQYSENGYTYPMADEYQEELEPEQDAAYKIWGKDWRMPTDEQFRELLRCCDCSYENVDGVTVLVAVGPNGNSIKLPLGGWKKGSNPIDKNEEAHYYTSSRSFEVGAFAKGGPYVFKASTGDTHYYDNGGSGDYHSQSIGYHFEEVAEGQPIYGYNIRPVLNDEKARAKPVVMTEYVLEYQDVMKALLDAYHNGDVDETYKLNYKLSSVNSEFSSDDQRAYRHWRKNEGASLVAQMESLKNDTAFMHKLDEFGETHAILYGTDGIEFVPIGPSIND